MQELKPAVKNTDPSSSHEAERNITQSGKRLTQTQQVAELVKTFSGLTASELLAHTHFDRSQLARRLPDARQQGLIYNGIIRKSAVTGRNEQTWRVK